MNARHGHRRHRALGTRWIRFRENVLIPSFKKYAPETPLPHEVVELFRLTFFSGARSFARSIGTIPTQDLTDEIDEFESNPSLGG